MVLLAQGVPAGRSLIDVHAGAAYGANRDGRLFEKLATATWRSDYGGPWARVNPNGTVAYGWRSRLPSELICDENRNDGFAFVLGMIDAFGAVGNTLASELIPEYGGRECREADPNAWPALLSGILPPE